MVQLRNVAIIAHVDHGKTTLVDAMLKQAGAFRANQPVGERVLDSNELERERGITILAKNTAIHFEGTKINIVDTPGHADFSGEVERILSMVDGALLVVDAAEGPMPQTRFVVEKALRQRLRPILVVNKIDRMGARPREVVDQVLELFIELGADDEQIDVPVLYADARAGVAMTDLPGDYRPAGSGHPASGIRGDMRPLLQAVVDHIPPPPGDPDAPVKLLVTTLDYDEYLGRIAIGRVAQGTLRAGQAVAVGRAPDAMRRAKVAELFTFGSLKRLAAEEVPAGDICAVAGIPDVAIGETISDPGDPAPLPPLEVDAPTVTMTFLVNDSPFAGRDGAYLTSRHLRERLWREAERNVGLLVEETDSPDAFRVSGRGELHLSIVIETMRREGYELAVSRPQVIYREQDGRRLEPVEEVVLDLPQETAGAVIERLGARRGEMQSMTPLGDDRVRLVYRVPARGLFGFAAEFTTLTRGYGVMSHTFAGYEPEKGPIPGRSRGSLVAWETGVTTAYALENAEKRGTLFVGPGEPVYAGQVVGEHAREGDLEINVCKKKHVTNIRSSTAEESVRLTPPKRLSLEQALEFIADDELVEVTPKEIRIRKRLLDRHARERAQKG